MKHRPKRRPRNLIYGLIDPRTLFIRYVGLTSRGMQRPKSHAKARGSLTNCKRWILELQREGLDYEIVILEVVKDATILDRTERWWIAFGRACGWPLTNHTPGGSLTEIEREARRRQKELVAARRADEQAVRERRYAEEYEADWTKRRLQMFKWIEKSEGASAAQQEQDYQLNLRQRREEGLDARCYVLFNKGRTDKEVARSLNETLERISRLRARWLEDGRTGAPPQTTTS